MRSMSGHYRKILYEPVAHLNPRCLPLEKEKKGQKTQKGETRDGRAEEEKKQHLLATRKVIEPGAVFGCVDSVV